MTTRAIYPARRAVEHAVTVPGVRPVRLFAVLWPLWQVEITANVYDEQAYEIIDRFLVRAIAEGGIDGRDELIAFYCLQPSLVDRCLAFLTVIGHLTTDHGRLRLTELGLRSARAGVRYTLKESRQKLLFERYTGRPLPRRHYHGSVTVLPTPDVPEDMLADRTRFLPLYAATAFHPRMVDALAARPDRADYNLPGQLRGIGGGAAQDAYLPVYLIETDNRDLLAYTAIGAERDAFLEAVCRDVPAIHARIDAENRQDPRDLWTEWLAGTKLGAGQPRRLANGVWRVTLTPAAFSGPPKLPLSRVGSFQLRKHHFLQLWCDDAELRGRAVKERALAMARSHEVETQADLMGRIDALASQLEVTGPTIAQLRSYAKSNRLHDHLAHLDDLG
ncbi:hypothetical protein AB0B89_28670 [Sphaerisporangium sp. NPDC049002]|uniref:hypothetical protein n=1 Tax=Sphaerisporangium sp. NPDC049002 TaxID=3155392 RepID=UPI0033DAFBA4